MSSNASIAAALLGGLLSFLSPCVLPLVPPYLVYLAGASLERYADAEPAPLVRRNTMLAALLFVAGFSTVFVALGATASTIGQGLAVFRAWFAGKLAGLESAAGFSLPISFDPLAILAGLCIIVMGLHFLGLTRVSFIMREKRMEMTKPVGLWGAYVMGLAFACGWTPCIGPVLSAIFAVATKETTVAKGAGLLAVYSAGLGIPFLIAAFAVEPFMAFLARFKRHMVRVEQAMGGLMVLTGIVFITGSIGQVSNWILDWFPALQKLG